MKFTYPDQRAKMPYLSHYSMLVKTEPHCHTRLTGAHNDGFFLNALKSLFRLFQCTFRYLETHSKRRCKICFCFRHPRGAWRFSKLQGLLCYFSENRCNWAFYEIEIFPDSSLYHIFESENFRFPFSTKIYRLTWRVKCENLNFRNS